MLLPHGVLRDDEGVDVKHSQPYRPNKCTKHGNTPTGSESRVAAGVSDGSISNEFELFTTLLKRGRIVDPRYRHPSAMPFHEGNTEHVRWIFLLACLFHQRHFGGWERWLQTRELFRRAAILRSY